jgi:NAD(P)-dependent dehydrogenase (short-subunit alcohol dehydrogenase family)
MVPKIIIPNGAYKYALSDPDLCIKKMMRLINLFPNKGLRASVSYAISKNFIIWFAKASAARFGAKGIRILSVSPGFFETPMGDMEREEANEYIKYCAIRRLGRVDEIAYLLAFCASNKASYLTGTDILCDGGCIAGKVVS